jgi:hypothetical protein
MDKLFFISVLIIISIVFVLYISPITNNIILTRPVWHNPKRIIDFEQDGSGTNQQLIDIYSLSHISHGILFYLLIHRTNIPIIKTYGFWIAGILELLWEIFENTPYIINKYRKKEEYKKYTGDSIVNIIGDIIFTMIGYYIAYKSSKYSLLYLVISEIILYSFNANLLHLSIGSLL